MANHKVYTTIVQAMKNGQLKEPFTQEDFRSACSGLGEGTYQAFLYKHRKDNPGRQSELFEMVGPGKFRLLRSLRYGLQATDGGVPGRVAGASVRASGGAG